jgi:hypothetical protein
VIDEVPAPVPVLEPNPDPKFPWHHFTWEYKIPEHWVKESIAFHAIKPQPPLPPSLPEIRSRRILSEEHEDFSKDLRERVKKSAGEAVDVWTATKSADRTPKEKSVLLGMNDWPKNHIAFSNIPGIGRPLRADGVLNAYWEADPEEKEFREARTAYREKISRLTDLITGAGLSRRDLGQALRDGEDPLERITASLDERTKTLARAKRAAKELKPLLGSPPKHPSQQ